MNATSPQHPGQRAWLEHDRPRHEAERALFPPSELRRVGARGAATDARPTAHPLAGLADRTREVFLVFDVRAQRYTEVSPAFEVVWGRPPADLLADASFLIEGVAPGDRPLVLAALTRQAAGEATELRYRIVRPDGSTRWVWDRAFPARDPQGELRRILTLATDVTEEGERERDEAEAKVRDAAAQAARARDELLSAMSHELRTPLDAVLGACEALSEGLYGPLGEAQISALQRVENGGRRLLSVVESILDFSSLAAGGVALSWGWTPVDDLCRAALARVREAAERKQQRVALEVVDGFVRVEVDAHRFVQVLVALLRNAIEFTPEGGAIGLEAGVDPRRERARFAVWDTGIGIAAADVARLFRPFVQLDAGLARERGSAGLGLAVARCLVEMHGGDLRVESLPQKGSRFSVDVPVRAAR